MKHYARHLDNGFYLISDRAAGALVSTLGQKLPKFGWEKFVMLSTDKGRFNAWLQRTDVRSGVRVQCKRGWRWAIYAIRPDGDAHRPNLGSEFTFEAVNSTTQAAA